MSDQEAIDRLFERWKRAVAERDIEAICKLVTEDAEFWTHGQPALTGRDAIRAALSSFWALAHHRQEFTRHELVVSGDLAFARGLEHNQIRMLSGGQERLVVQRAFMVMRRDSDGEWRFSRGMTNLPPQEQPAITTG